MEPEVLRRGKQFEQDVWEFFCSGVYATDITAFCQQFRIPTGELNAGRRFDVTFLLDNTMYIDPPYLVDDGGKNRVVIEIKATRWDGIRADNVAKNLGAHRRQVWRYYDYLWTDDLQAFQGALVYPEAPTTPGLRQRIEEFHGEWGISVYWFSELTTAGTLEAHSRGRGALDAARRWLEGLENPEALAEMFEINGRICPRYRLPDEILGLVSATADAVHVGHKPERPDA